METMFPSAGTAELDGPAPGPAVPRGYIGHTRLDMMLPEATRWLRLGSREDSIFSAAYSLFQRD